MCYLKEQHDGTLDMEYFQGYYDHIVNALLKVREKYAYLCKNFFTKFLIWP